MIGNLPSSRWQILFLVMKASSFAAAVLIVLCLTGCLAAVAADQTTLSAATTLAARNDWNGAADQVELYRRDHPDSVEAAVLQAEIWIHLGLVSDANSLLQRIISVHPRSIVGLSASAELSRTLGDKATAERILLRCTRYAPRSAEVWERLGDLYLSLGRKEALAAFRHAQALAPTDPLAGAGVAAARHQQGQEVLAEHDYRRALVLNSTAPKPDPMIDYLYAEFLQDKAQYRESISEYDRALQRDPDLLDAHLGRAKSLVRLQEWARAEDDLRVCLNDDQKKIAALNLMAKVAQAEGRPEDAQRYATQAEQLSSADLADKATNNSIASHLQNAHFLMLSKHFAEAAESYQQLLHDHAKVSEAWFYLGQCHVDMGELDAAQSDIRHFLSLESKSASGHVLLGRILLRQAQTNAARNQFLQALDIDPLFADARLGIAASYIVESNYPEAIRILRIVAASPGATSDSQLMLIEALYKNHQQSEAMREIDRLLKREPANKTALQMKASLIQGSAQR